MELTYKKQNCTEITEEFIGKECTLAGWVSTVRDLGGIIFVEKIGRASCKERVSSPV